MAGSNGQLETSCILTVASDSEDEMQPPVFLRELHDQEAQEGDKMVLEVEVKEVEHPEAPDFLTHTMTRNVNEGQSVTFKCQVKGHPLPSVMWEKDGVRLSSDDKYKMTQIKDQHTLTINNVSHSDAGPYNCHLVNKVGETSAICVLKIRSDTTQSTAETLKTRLSRLSEIHSRTEPSHTDQGPPPVLSFSAAPNGGTRSHVEMFGNRAKTYTSHHAPLAMEAGSNSSPSSHTVKTSTKKAEVPFSQANGAKTLRQSNVLIHNNDNDFLSVLHRSKNLDEPKGITVPSVKNSEVVTDFRNALKHKQIDDGLKTVSDVDFEDLDVQEVLLKRKEKRSGNSSSDAAVVEAVDLKPKYRLHNEESDTQELGSRFTSFVHSRSDRVVSDGEFLDELTFPNTESDEHLDHLFEFEPSPAELNHTGNLEDLRTKLETGSQIHSSINFEMSGNSIGHHTAIPDSIRHNTAIPDSVGHYTAIPVEFIESSDPGGERNENNSSEIVFKVQMSHPMTFVQSYEVDMIKETGQQGEMAQPGPHEQHTRKVSYIEFIPKVPSKSSSGSDKWSTHKAQEVTAQKSNHDNLNDDSDEVFGENTHSETLNMEKKTFSGYDSWRDNSSLHSSGILKSERDSGHVRFARHSGDILNSTSEDKADKKTASMKSSSKSTSSYEGQEKPEFQCVQLRHASKPPGVSDLRASKNLSKSTEMLFNVRLRPVASKNDNSSTTVRKSQFSSSPASIKAKSKSSFDLADKGSYHRSSNTQRTLPGSSQLNMTVSSAGKVWKNDAGDKRSAIYSKDWPTNRRSAGKTVPSSLGEKTSFHKSNGRFTSPGARHQDDGNPESKVVKKSKEKQTFQTKLTTEITVRENKNLSEVGKSLSNDGESVQIPESYLGRYESKRHSLQADSDQPVSSIKSKFSEATLKDSQSLSKSIGNLNVSTSSKVSSKRELFETLEQANKPNWQKSQKKVGDRVNPGSVVNISSKRESSYFDSKPEWVRTTTHRNIDEKINAIRKEKLEKIDHSAAPVWVKTGELSNNGRNNDTFKDLTTSDDHLRKVGTSSKVSPPSKAKMAPPVAPKPAAKLIPNEGIEEASVADLIRTLPAKDRPSEHDSPGFRSTFEAQDHLSVHETNSDMKGSLVTSTGLEVRSSMEDMDSAISISSSSSEVSSATNDWSYNGEDTGRRLRVGHSVLLKDTARKDNSLRSRDKDELAEGADAPSTDPDMLNTEGSTISRSSKRGSRENIVDLTAVVHREHGAVRQGSTSSQDSGLILDISNTVINTADVVATDTVCQVTSSSLEPDDLEPALPSFILKERRGKRLADRGTDNEGTGRFTETQAPDIYLSGDVVPHLNNGTQAASYDRASSTQAAYDRAKESRSKFRDSSKNWERIDLVSSDTTSGSALADRAALADRSAPREAPVARPRLKDRLRDLASDQLVEPVRSSSPVNTKTTGVSAVGVNAENGRQPQIQQMKAALEENAAVAGHSYAPANSAADGLELKRSTVDSLSAAPPAPYGTSTPSTVAPPQPTSPPNFPSLLKDVTVMYGCRATLQCTVLGNPSPDLKWLHNMTLIEPCQNIDIVYEGNVARLTVAETYSEHVGDYCCWAKNPYGSLSTHCRLDLEAANKKDSRAFEGPVSHEPRILSLTPRSVSVVRGSTLALTLTFEGEPAPQVAWILNERQLTSDGRVKVMTDNNTSVLTIHPVEPSDAGAMSVCLTSSIGSDQLVTRICIEDIPGPPEGKPHVYEITKHSASLSWSPPRTDGGSPVTYYTIEAKVRQQTTWDVLVPNCKDMNYHISDLKPCMSYQFRVRACNKHGLGPPSEPSDRTITTDPFRSFSDEESEDELPFEPREVTLNTREKFEDLYELGLEVGKGKFGVVYKCIQREDGRIFAAKILKSREKQMIKHEIEIMNCLRHPKLLLLWDAFEEAKRIILVMEYVGAGELFERVIDDDFVLTERDCVHFLRQICEGVAYMHGLNILHLDLKPENVLCVAENSNRIKIIDFGLARKYNPDETVKAMFGTPEFIAPEVINFDAISYHTDMWSVGVICYVLLSGLSPFLGDDDNETLSNVTTGDFDFDDEAFEQISDEAKDFITKLLVKKKEKRMLTSDCLAHAWLSQDEVDGLRYKRLNTERLKKFMVRRKWLKTGKAVLAVGRLRKSTSLSNLSRSSSNDSLLSSPSVATAVTESGSSTNSFDEDIASASSQSTLTSAISAEHEDNSRFVRISAHDHKGNDGAAQQNRDLNENHLMGRTENQRAVNHRTLNGTKLNKITADDHTWQSSSSQLFKDGSDIVNKQMRTNEGKFDSSASPLSAPKFVKTMKRCKTCTGDAARFDVVVQGSPEPVITWYFENDEIQPDDRHTLSSDKSTGAHSLVIRSIHEEDEGDYSCKAYNSLGEVTCTDELSVLVI